VKDKQIYWIIGIVLLVVLIWQVGPQLGLFALFNPGDVIFRTNAVNGNYIVNNSWVVIDTNNDGNLDSYGIYTNSYATCIPSNFLSTFYIGKTPENYNIYISPDREFMVIDKINMCVVAHLLPYTTQDSTGQCGPIQTPAIYCYLFDGPNGLQPVYSTSPTEPYNSNNQEVVYQPTCSEVIDSSTGKVVFRTNAQDLNIFSNDIKYTPCDSGYVLFGTNYCIPDYAYYVPNTGEFNDRKWISLTLPNSVIQGYGFMSITTTSTPINDPNMNSVKLFNLPDGRGVWIRETTPGPNQYIFVYIETTPGDLRNFWDFINKDFSTRPETGVYYEGSLIALQADISSTPNPSCTQTYTTPTICILPASGTATEYPSGNKVSNVEITLKDGATTLLTTTTDSNGYYSFNYNNAIPLYTYFIHAIKSGYMWSGSGASCEDSVSKGGIYNFIMQLDTTPTLKANYETCTLPSECQSGYCTDGICAPISSTNSFKTIITVLNKGNINTNLRISSITSTNAYMQSKFAGMTATQLVNPGNSASWQSNFIYPAVIPNGAYTINVQLCGKDTANQFTEVCKTASKTLTFLNGVMV